MAIYKSDIVDINLETGSIHRSFLNHTIGSGDNSANRFGVRTFRDGVPADLSGASCQAVFMNAAGTNIALTSYGTVSGNEAYVTLPQACYNVEGQFCLAIKLAQSGVTVTTRIVDGVVSNTGTTGSVAPTSSVPTYQEILSTYDAMTAATAAANTAIAEEFDASENYPAGKNVINDGALYILPNGHTAGTTWANTTKVASNLGDQVTDLKSAFDNTVDTYLKKDPEDFPGSGLTWEQGTISSSGVDGSSTTYIRTSYISVSDYNKYRVAYTGTGKYNNKEYIAMVVQYKGNNGQSDFISRKYIKDETGARNSKRLEAETTYVRFLFGFLSSQSQSMSTSQASDFAAQLYDDLNDDLSDLDTGIDETNEKVGEILTHKDVAKTLVKTSTGVTTYGTSGYISYSNGIFKSDSNYTTYLYTFEKDAEMYVTKTGTGLVTAVLYNQTVDTIPTGTTAASAYYVKGGRSDKSSPDALPSSSAKWTVPAGYMLIMSVQTGGNYDADFVVNYADAEPFLSNEIHLNDTQAEEVESIIEGKQPYIKYGAVDTDIGARGKQQITVYLPATDGYIKYAFVRSESNAINSNIWRIDKCYKCNDSKTVLFPITNSGEWEMAIKINGASDFIGGNAHGDEVFTAFHLLVDGVEVDDITSLQPQTFETVRIVVTSLMYDPRDEATLETREQFTPAGTHGREYVITKDGIRLNQFVVLDAAYTLAASYMTMLPIIRGNDTVSADQITDHYYANNNYTVYDVSVGESGSQGYGWKSNVTRATIWGEDSGISATVEMLKQPEIDNAGARKFQVQSTINYYNKFYWSICGVNDHNYSASAGQRFVTETMYQINAK